MTETTTEATTETPTENTTETPDTEESTLPEEILFDVYDGTFVNDELLDIVRHISGTYKASNSYKLISEYDGRYYYNYDFKTASCSSTNDLDKAIEEAVVYKKGDEVSINSDMAGDSVYESFLESYKKYTLLVYTAEGKEKYSIKYTDLPKCLGNTRKIINLSFVCVGDITDRVGNVIAKQYKVLGGTPSAITVTGISGEYFFQNETERDDYTFDFYGADGTYNYSAELTNGYVVTGTITQSGIYTGHDASNLEQDIPAVDIEIKKPTVTLSDIPETECESFELTITSDIDAHFWFNGEWTDTYSKSAKFTITSNGVFHYLVSTKDGGNTEGTVTIDCIQTGGTVGNEEPWTPVDWTGKE